MKVAFILSEFNMPNVGLRGANVYLLKFIMNVTKNFQVDVFCLNSDFQNSESLNINIVKNFSEITKEFLEQNQYDFVYNFSESSNKFKTFCICHSHSLIYREQVVRTSFEMFIKRIFDKKRLMTPKSKEAIKKGFAVNQNIILANSTLAKDDYEKFVDVDEKKVFVLTPCVNIEPSETLSDNKIFTFGISAVSFALKGGYTLLNSLFLLNFKNPDFKVKIIYPNHKNKYFLKIFVWLCGLGKKIEWVDFVENMRDFYKSIDCLIAPSREETFGLVILEAMTCSRPVLISSRCGAKDIIQDGENGWIFEYDQNAVKNLADKLELVLNEKNINKISEKAFETSQKYDENHHAQKILEIFTKTKKES